MDIETISDSVLEESVLDNEEMKDSISSLAKKCSDQQVHIFPCHHSVKEKGSDLPIHFSGKGSSWKHSHIECEVEKKFQVKGGKMEIDARANADNHKNYSAEIGAKINY